MLESLSCIFTVTPGTDFQPEARLGELPEDLGSLEIPLLEAGQPALRRIGDKLVVLVPTNSAMIAGFVLDTVPPATQLKAVAQHLSLLAASGSIGQDALPKAGQALAAKLLTQYLGNSAGRMSRKRVLESCCDAITNSGLAEDAAIVVCRPGRQAGLTLSSVRLEPMRDTISTLMESWRGDDAVSQIVSAADLREDDLLREDTIILLDKAGAGNGFVSLPAADDGGFGFLLFNPSNSDAEAVCEELRSLLELKHRTRRDWSRRRQLFRYGSAAAALLFLIFLLLPTDRMVTASGTTRPRDVEVISFHFPTYLDRMEVEVGETLDPGAPIAVLSAPDQQDARASALFQISIEEAAASAALASDDYGSYVQAQSRVSLQRTRLNQINARLAQLNPAASETGRVVAALSSGERGRYLPAGTEIARLQTGNTYIVELMLSGSDASLIEVGQTGELSLRGQFGRAFPVRLMTPPTPSQAGTEPTGPPVLVATALIDADGATEIVPGLSGFAQIDTGRAMRIQVWSRHIVEFIRMKAWTILNWRI